MTNEEKWQRGRRFMAMNDAGKTYSEIGAEVGLTPVEVYQAIMIVRPMHKNRPWLDQDIDAVIKLRAAGQTLFQIQDATGIPKGTVAMKIAELQLPAVNSGRAAKCPALTS